MELLEIPKIRKALRDLAPLQEKLRVLMTEDRKRTGLTCNEYATKLGSTWGEVDRFEKKKKVITGRGRLLSALCKQLKKQDIFDRMTELCSVVPNEKIVGVSLFSTDIIDVVFDIVEYQAKHSELSYESYSKLFGTDSDMVLGILLMTQDEIAKLQNGDVLDRMLGRLVDDDFESIIQMAIEDEAKSLVAICDKIRGYRQKYIVTYPTIRETAEAIGVPVTGMSEALRFDGKSGNKRLYRITAEKILVAFERFETDGTPLPKSLPEASIASEDDSVPGSEELETNVRALLNNGMEKQALAEKLGIPRQSMAHILIRRASTERVNKLLPITHELLKQLEAPPASPVVTASPKTVSNGKAETPVQGDEKHYGILLSLVNALRNTGGALEECVRSTGMVPRQRDKHELARLVWLLVDAGHLTGTDLRDALEGRPIKDSPAALAMLQALGR